MSTDRHGAWSIDGGEIPTFSSLTSRWALSTNRNARSPGTHVFTDLSEIDAPSMGCFHLVGKVFNFARAHGD